MAAATVRIDDSAARDGVRSARVVFRDGEMPLRFEHHGGALSPHAGADPFVIAAILPAMRHGEDLHVAGQVTAHLLRNLDDWQGAWRQWAPKLYTPVAVTADEVVTGSPPQDGPVLAAFSGGVDATFTAYRHLAGRAGVRPRLDAALLVQGADIAEGDDDTFGRARVRAEKMLASSGVPVLTVRTNFRSVFTDWEHGHGAALAACMALFQDRFTQGLLGSTEDVSSLVLPWGSNPITDHLLSTGRMAIRNDGSGYSRTEKVAAIADWTEATDLLRVCWQGDKLDRNCGRCEKCIRTILNFRAATGTLPGCFDRDVNDAQIRALRLRPVPIAEAESIINYRRAVGAPGTSWARALGLAVRTSRLRNAARSQVKRLAIRLPGVRSG